MLDWWEMVSCGELDGVVLRLVVKVVELLVVILVEFKGGLVLFGVFWGGIVF